MSAAALCTGADLPLLEAACRYAERGWSIIPIRHGRTSAQHKRPALRSWAKYQRTLPTAQETRDWFTRPNLDGMALILGDVSGGVTARDFDAPGAYDRWATDHPRLARELPTVKTGRIGGHGRHVLFRCPGIKGACFTDGELRANGQYIIVPPSRHPSGQQYEYIVELPPGPLPLVDPVSAGLLGFATESTESTEPTEDNGVTTDVIERGALTFSPALTNAFDLTKPTNHTQRNKRLFDFARMVKAMPEYREARPSALKPLVREWHRRALPYIGTKPFEDSWVDFVRGWDKVKWPSGSDPMKEILTRAREAESCAAVREYEQDGPKLLANICRELQRVAGGGVFYLSSRKAGELLGVDHVQAWRWLALLEIDGVLVCAKRGERGNGKNATRYRYIAPD